HLAEPALVPPLQPRHRAAHAAVRPGRGGARVLARPLAGVPRAAGTAGGARGPAAAAARGVGRGVVAAAPVCGGVRGSVGDAAARPAHDRAGPVMGLLHRIPGVRLLASRKGESWGELMRLFARSLWAEGPRATWRRMRSYSRTIGDAARAPLPPR